jgi:hypothetical protein
MDIDRRVFVKGIVLTSFAGLTINSSLVSLVRAALSTETNSPGRTAALVSDGVRRSSFLQGIAMTPGGAKAEVLTTDLSLAFLKQLNLLLRSEGPARIVGLVDDASSAWMVQIARGANARVPWLGQHFASAEQTRHRIISTDSSARGIVEPAQQSHAPLTMLDASREGALTGSEQCPGILGLLLASCGSQDLGDTQLPATNLKGRPLSGTFASIVIETDGDHKDG